MFDECIKLEYLDLSNFKNNNINNMDLVLNEINKRQHNLRTGKEISKEKKSDNIELVEKVGKTKGLSSEEIKKEVDKTQILEDMITMGTIMKEQILAEKQKNQEKYISEEEVIKNESDE